MFLLKPDTGTVLKGTQYKYTKTIFPEGPIYRLSVATCSYQTGLD